MKAIRVLAGLVLVFGLGCAGLLQTKVSQCNSLIDIINPAAERMSTFGDMGDEDDMAATAAKMEEMASLFESTAAQVDAVELSDETIQAYAQQYAQMCRDIAAHSREMAELTKQMDGAEQDPSKGLQLAGQLMGVMAKLESTVSQEDAIVDGLNAYCQE